MSCPLGSIKQDFTTPLLRLGSKEGSHASGKNSSGVLLFPPLEHEISGDSVRSTKNEFKVYRRENHKFQGGFSH